MRLSSAIESPKHHVPREPAARIQYIHPLPQIPLNAEKSSRRRRRAGGTRMALRDAANPSSTPC
jgi:hypothetical protein